MTAPLCPRILSPLLLLLLLGGCRGEVVGHLSLASLGSSAVGSFTVEMGHRYQLWERYRYDETGWHKGRPRSRCFRWRLQLTPLGGSGSSGRPRQLNCATFTRDGCPSSDYRSGWRCRLNDCASELTFPQSGRIRLEAKVVEGRCRGARSFKFTPRIKWLKLEVTKR